MSYQDVDHKFLVQAFSAKNMYELVSLAAECGCCLSDKSLKGITTIHSCNDDYHCFELEVRW